MLPFLVDEGELPFKNGDFLFVPQIRSAVETKKNSITAYTVDPEAGTLKEFQLRLGDLTDDEREIILDGCLINYYREHKS
jgi:aconitate hydratase